MATMLASIVVRTPTGAPSHSATHFQGILGGAVAIASGVTTLLVRGPVNIVDSDDSDSGADDEDGSRGNPILIKSEANDDGRHRTGRMVGYMDAGGSGSAEDQSYEPVYDTQTIVAPLRGVWDK